eukprot:TRINITY_DN66461_c5_g3_i1.p1 TRINITY_DN66461_c5_g3~~TRINITY_DN66461_c5_g3_i1.p1  ORF type:complete len:761 (-),score=110.43 TRINITY_DN66461_c5_g3_i1:1534-3816(-)
MALPVQQEEEKRLEELIQKHRAQLTDLLKPAPPPTTAPSLVIKLDRAANITSEKSSKGIYILFQLGKASVQTAPKKDTVQLDFNETHTIPLKVPCDELKILVKEKAFMKDSVLCTGEVKGLTHFEINKPRPFQLPLHRQSTKKVPNEAPILQLTLVCDGFGYNPDKWDDFDNIQMTLRDRISETWGSGWTAMYYHVYNITQMFIFQRKETPERQAIEQEEEAARNSYERPPTRNTAMKQIQEQEQASASAPSQRPASRQTAGSEDELSRLERELAQLRGDAAEQEQEQNREQLQKLQLDLEKQLQDCQTDEQQQRLEVSDNWWNVFQSFVFSNNNFLSFVNIPSEETEARKRLEIAENTVYISIGRQCTASWKMALFKQRISTSMTKTPPKNPRTHTEDDGSSSDESLSSSVSSTSLSNSDDDSAHEHPSGANLQLDSGMEQREKPATPNTLSVGGLADAEGRRESTHSHVSSSNRAPSRQSAKENENEGDLVGTQPDTSTVDSSASDTSSDSEGSDRKSLQNAADSTQEPPQLMKTQSTPEDSGSSSSGSDDDSKSSGSSEAEKAKEREQLQKEMEDEAERQRQAEANAAATAKQQAEAEREEARRQEAKRQAELDAQAEAEQAAKEKAKQDAEREEAKLRQLKEQEESENRRREEEAQRKAQEEKQRAEKEQKKRELLQKKRAEAEERKKQQALLQAKKKEKDEGSSDSSGSESSSDSGSLDAGRQTMKPVGSMYGTGSESGSESDSSGSGSGSDSSG